jgi:hypothetical protein
VDWFVVVCAGCSRAQVHSVSDFADCCHVFVWLICGLVSSKSLLSVVNASLLSRVSCSCECFLCFFVYCYILTTFYFFFFHLCLTDAFVLLTRLFADASLCWRVSFVDASLLLTRLLVMWVCLFMYGLWHTDYSFSFSKASFCQRVLLSTRLKFSQVCVSFFNTCFYWRVFFWRVFLLTRVLCHASFFRWVFFMLLTCLLGWRVFLSGDLFSLINLFFCWRVFFVDASVC